MDTTQQTPRRGRPPMDWLDWDGLYSVPPGTAVLVDSGQHEVRLVGRVVGRSRQVLRLRGRDGEVHRLRADAVERARVLDGVYEPGDPVLRLDPEDPEADPLPSSRWRGGVVAVGTGRRRGRLLVEFVRVDRSGRTMDTAWIAEDELVHADDYLDSLPQAADAVKPGPAADDPTVEAINQTAYTERAGGAA